MSFIQSDTWKTGQLNVLLPLSDSSSGTGTSLKTGISQQMFCRSPSTCGRQTTKNHDAQWPVF
jgi:hypothetical protein